MNLYSLNFKTCKCWEKLVGNTCFLVGNEDLSKEAKIAVFKIMFLSTLLNESESSFCEEQHKSNQWEWDIEMC